MDSSQVSLASLYALIQNSNTEIKQHIDSKIQVINEHLSKIENSLDSLNEQLEEVQTRVSANEDNIQTTQKKLSALEKQIKIIETKQQQLEDNQRAKNLRLIALPEGSEHADLPGFLAAWIPQLLGENYFGAGLVVDRAWRIPAHAQHADKPRPVLLTLQSTSDRQKILDLARKKKDLLYKNQRVYFFPDYPVLKKRKEFDGVKKSPKSMGINGALLFPAKLRIMHEGNTRVFTSSSAAEKYIKELQMTSSSTMDI